MSEIRIGDSGFFDHGLDEISEAPLGVRPGLPTHGQLSPAEARAAPLSQLLAPSDIESFLNSVVRPDIPDRDTLTPSRFQQALSTTLDTLVQISDTLHASDPDGAKTVRQAIRVLREDVGLRELVQMYRSAVHQG